jgi:hypothetical protein
LPAEHLVEESTRQTLDGLTIGFSGSLSKNRFYWDWLGKVDFFDGRRVTTGTDKVGRLIAIYGFQQPGNHRDGNPNGPDNVGCINVVNSSSDPARPRNEADLSGAYKTSPASDVSASDPSTGTLTTINQSGDIDLRNYVLASNFGARYELSNGSWLQPSTGITYTYSDYALPLHLLWITAADAESRALLVGVSGYAPGVGPLEGPRNDIQEMWRLLTERGFSPPSIRVLADGLPDDAAREAAVACAGGREGTGCPTYANITRALEDLATAAASGDYVVVYFSGHGVQVPDLIRRDEPDGLTEAFVPIDVGRWNPSSRLVANLLTDDAIAAAIEKVRAKGAFVWAIFDTCHAGDMVRGAADYAVPRRIRGDALAIPDAAYADARRSRPKMSASQRRRSSLEHLVAGRPEGLAGFYAAQSDQLALEFGFDETDASGKASERAMGAFTNSLRQVLAQDPNATYRQLAQQIAEIYGDLGADMPAPYFEGDLDRPVFDAKVANAIWSARWEAGRIVVEAGELDGLAEGALIALLHDGSAPRAARVAGYARVDWVSASRAEASPVEHAGKAPPTPASGHLGARLEQPSIGAVLHVALPPPGDLAARGSEAAVSALEQLRAMRAEVRPFALDWVEAGRPAQVHLRLADGRIWLLSQFGEWRRTGPRRLTPSIPAADPNSTANSLLEKLWQVARALNLQRVATGYRQIGKVEGNAELRSLKTDVFLYRPASRRRRHVQCPDPPLATDAPPKGAVRISGENLPSLTHCDIVYVVMRNEGKLPIDVTLLYLDGESQIQCFTAWGKARIAPRGTADELRSRMQAIRITAFDQKTGAPLPIGRDRLLVIGVQKPARDPLETTFCHLARPSIASARGAASVTGDASSSFETLLNQAGLAVQPTRGFAPVSHHERNSAAIRTFSWSVSDLPPS